MPKLKPLFTWAGGKSKMLKHHTPFLPTTIDSYSEPFFGGGAMFLHIMQTFKPSVVYINDINESIINIYRAIKEDPELFCNTLDVFQSRYIPLSKEDRKKYYYQVRQQHAFDYQTWSPTFSAAVLYFLMKTGFNGIWQINANTNNRYGTPSGLLNQKDTVYDRSLVLAWSDLLTHVHILSKDYSDVPVCDFGYFDPPYRDSFTNYSTTWGDAQTLELIQYVREYPGHLMLCNRCDGTSFFDDQSDIFDIHRFPVTYTAGRRKKTEDGFEAKKAIEILLTK